MINTVPVTPNRVLSCLEPLYQLRLPAFLHGAPGIGKSSLIRDFAASKGLELQIVLLSQIEAADLRGLPALNHATQTTVWYRPEFLPTSGAGILFLDELTGAEPRLQVAAYQLILDRRIGEYHLPDGWWVVGAGNAPDDGAVAYDMGSALADRLVHFKVVPEPKEWIRWGQNHGIAPEVLTFIQVKPDFLESNQMQQAAGQLIGPTPRSWERVSKVISAEPSRDAREFLVAGIVGEAAAAEFFHVVEELKDLPPMERLFESADDAKKLAKMLPATLSGLYGLTYSLAAYCSQLPDFQKAIRILEAMSEASDDLPRAEVQALAMELLLEKAGRLGLLFQLGDTPEYGAYRKKAKEIVEL